MSPADHLVIAPILLPLAVGAFLLLLDEKRRMLKAILSMATIVALLAIAGGLVWLVGARPAATVVYPLGNWPAPFGIELVADRLSALMVLLASVLGLCCLTFALARWSKAGPRFHTLFLLLLAGLNGAFLAGDLFNLFVFFEVLLAASYGLVLHGSGTVRVTASLHYIPINLVASSLFLVGVSLIYGVTGTLNMGDLVQTIASVPAADRTLLEAGAAVLAIAFLVKAGMWPLGFWLPPTYVASSAPVAAMFAIMSKVGVYVILRLYQVFFGGDAGALAGFGSTFLFYGGIATIIFGGIGVLASQSMPRLAGYAVLVSSGTLLAVVGTGDGAVITGGLYYLVSSTLTIAAFFLLIELIERGRDPAADVLAATIEIFGDPDDDLDEPEDEVGVAIPATIALLGGAFVACTVLVAGMPPLSGFVAKFAILSALLGEPGAIPPSHWVLVVVLVLSGMAALIAMSRSGIHALWAPLESTIPTVRIAEVAPVLGLLALTIALTVLGGPAMHYMEATTQAIFSPASPSLLPAPVPSAVEAPP